MAREQLKQVVTNRVSQFFAVDSFKIEGEQVIVVEPLNLELLNRSGGKLNDWNDWNIWNESSVEQTEIPVEPKTETPTI